MLFWITPLVPDGDLLQTDWCRHQEMTQSDLISAIRICFVEWPIVIHCHICCSFYPVQLYLYHTLLTVKADRAGCKLKVIDFFKKQQQVCAYMCVMLMALVWPVLALTSAPTDRAPQICSCFVALSWWLRFSGTQLPFAYSVFRSLWQMPADGSSQLPCSALGMCVTGWWLQDFSLLQH